MRPRHLLSAGLTLVAATTLTAGCSLVAQPADLQVYSARHYDLEEAFVEYEDQTGQSIDFIYGDDAELLERLKAEGADSPADVYMTVDAGQLWNAARQGQLATLESPALDDAIPAEYRDPGNRWFGLALRARTVIYNPDRVDPSELDPEDTYAGLADPTWQDRLCMRDETESYTQSLVASLIDLYGRDRAQAIVQGWVDNDVEIMSNDVELIDAVDAGQCDVALVNHYYLAGELEDDPHKDVELYWASQQGAGTHVNISGAGVVKTSDAPKKAQQLIEWLATDGQNDFVDGNHEFPVNPAVEPEPLIAGFGDFKAMPIDPKAYGTLNAQAVDVLAETGYR